ncbi:glutamine--fructose-6-phosphate transaminase (isomerizing), partial [Mortierella sp. NVP85]
MIFKSVHFPNEVVATRRGSPLLIGVKTPKKLKVDFVDVEFGGIAEEISGTVEGSSEPLNTLEVPQLRRSESRAFLSEDGVPQQIEYFLASDPSAV